MQKTKPINFRHHHRSTIIPYKKSIHPEKNECQSKTSSKENGVNDKVIDYDP